MTIIDRQTLSPPFQRRSSLRLRRRKAACVTRSIAIAFVFVLVGGRGVAGLYRHDLGQSRLVQLVALDELGRGFHGDFALLLRVLRDQGLDGAILERGDLSARRVVSDDLYLSQSASLAEASQRSDRALIVGREEAPELRMGGESRSYDFGRLLGIVALILRAKIDEAGIFLQFLLKTCRACVLRGGAGRLGDDEHFSLAIEQRVDRIGGEPSPRALSVKI